jgi:hypothetical protein
MNGPGPKGNLKFEFLQICPEFDLVQTMSFQTKKIQIKYGSVGFELRNKFPYGKFSRFAKQFELKFQGTSMCWIRLEFDLKQLGVSEFDEIWPANFSLHLDAIKINYK